MTINHSNCILIAQCCLRLAEKCEVIWIADPKSYIYLNGCNEDEEEQALKDFYLTEIDVFKALKCNIYGKPTHTDFIKRFSQLINLTAKEASMATFFTLLCLFDTKTLKIKPSILSFAAIKLSLNILT
jgi:hypothetical protein